MKASDFLERLAAIRRWNRGTERAPHKPLLVLLALARTQHGEPRLMRFVDIEPKLRELLRNFGPPRQHDHPEYPFWRLQADGIWEVHANSPLGGPRSRIAPSVSFLRASGAIAGFSPDIDTVLRRSSTLASQAAEELLHANFPISVQEDIVSALGLNVDVQILARDVEFRRSVLRAYEYRCAFCGFDGRLDDTPVGLEAAHVRWHRFRGPARRENGLALCSSHHKAFDMGALGLDDNLRLLVSVRLNGGNRTQALLGSLAGKRMRVPLRGQPAPAIQHVRWHRSNVFKPPARAA